MAIIVIIILWFLLASYEAEKEQKQKELEDKIMDLENELFFLRREKDNETNEVSY